MNRLRQVRPEKSFLAKLFWYQNSFNFRHFLAYCRYLSLFRLTNNLYVLSYMQMLSSSDTQPGGRIMAQKPQVTSIDFENAVESFTKLVRIVTGTETGKPRFRGFKILDNVKEYVAKAMNFFAEGKFPEALHEMTEAQNCVVNTERAYARNAVDKFFMPMILSLGKLDGDLNEAIGKKLREYQEIIGLMRSSNQVDMNEVSRRYWALLERIESAPAEQSARLANRARKAEQQAAANRASQVAERRRVQAERDDEARKKQAEADVRRRAQREERARDMASQLAAIL